MSKIDRISDLALALIIAYNSYTDRKIMWYEVVINRCEDLVIRRITDIHTQQPVDLTLPEMKAILKVKITKTQAKELIARGYTVAAGYSLTGK